MPAEYEKIKHMALSVDDKHVIYMTSIGTDHSVIIGNILKLISAA